MGASGSRLGSIAHDWLSPVPAPSGLALARFAVLRTRVIASAEVRPQSTRVAKIILPRTEEKSPLYGQTHRLVQEMLDGLQRERLTPWSFARVEGAKGVEDAHGRTIRLGGNVGFDGSRRSQYWNFFDPFIRKGVVEVLDRVTASGAKTRCPSVDYLGEAANLLKLAVRLFHEELVQLDQFLRRAGPSDPLPAARSVVKEIAELNRFIDEHVAAKEAEAPNWQDEKEIGCAVGDKIESRNQSGGITAHTVTISTSRSVTTEEARGWTLQRVATVVGLIAAVLAIFAAFGIYPAGGMMNREKGGDNVTSINQSGGITAHTVNVSPAARRLSAEQKSDLVAILKSGPVGQIAIDLPFSSDSEIQGFAAQLEDALVGGGWTIKSRAVIPMDSHATGIFLQVRSQESALPRAGWLQHALSRIGFEAKGVVNSGAEADQVDLIIARMPE